MSDPIPANNASAPVAKNNFSSARKLMIAALVIHFFSLFFLYQDASTEPGNTILWNTGRFVQLENVVQQQTGFQLKPFAAAVIIGLLALFMSKLYHDPFWKKYGYWISLVLIVVFATGGAVVRTTGGNITLVTVGMMLIAALLNVKDRRIVTQ